MFEAFPKLPRLNRFVSVTEKIDGTNGQILIRASDDTLEEAHNDGAVASITSKGTRYYMYAGCRTRMLSKGDDNYGFRDWVRTNAEDLFSLGEGRHFGEWWGPGIGRDYGLLRGVKRFSLFNAGRWVSTWSPDGTRHPLELPHQQYAPVSCHVVPIIAEGEHGIDEVSAKAMRILANVGSFAAPGYRNPEGVVVFHKALGSCFKVTFEDLQAQRA